MTLASSSAMIPRKSPTPADTASFRFCGIESMTYCRIGNTEIKKNSTPEQNTAASACCQVFVSQYNREGEECVGASAIG
jgi:hypothetical protein